jgi:hypothetical protein
VTPENAIGISLLNDTGFGNMKAKVLGNIFNDILIDGTTPTNAVKKRE